MVPYNHRIILLGILIAMSVFCIASADNILITTGKDVLNLPWGIGEGEIGIIDLPEAERCGPLSFTVDESNVFILDTVNKRVIKKSQEEQPTILAQNVTGWALCPDYRGGVFVQQNDLVINVTDQKAGITSRYPVKTSVNVPVRLIEGYGNELMVDRQGFPVVRSVSQDVYTIENAPLIRSPFAELSKIPSLALEYTIKRLDGNQVRVLGMDSDGKILVSVSVKIDGGTAGAALFKGLDVKGNIYLEIENIRGASTGLEIHRYAPDGTLLALFDLPNKYFTTVYKKTEVTPEGSVFQMLTTPEGVRIIKY